MTYRSVAQIVEATGGPRTRRILILTALPHEAAAVLSHLGPIGSTITLDGTVFECGVFSHGGVLTRLLAYDEPEIWRAACEVFRLADTLSPGASTIALLTALERRPELISRSHASFLAQKMGTLLPHEAPLVARVVQGLIRAWRETLRDTTTSTALAAPELIDLALTLHRLGPETQEIGTRLFEQLIEIDAWEARQALDEIDNRFLEQAPSRRSRLARRRRNRRDG